LEAIEMIPRTMSIHTSQARLCTYVTTTRQTVDHSRQTQHHYLKIHNNYKARFEVL